MSFSDSDKVSCFIFQRQLRLNSPLFPIEAVSISILFLLSLGHASVSVSVPFPSSVSDYKSVFGSDRVFVSIAVSYSVPFPSFVSKSIFDSDSVPVSEPVWVSVSDLNTNSHSLSIPISGAVSVLISVFSILYYISLQWPHFNFHFRFRLIFLVRFCFHFRKKTFPFAFPVFRFSVHPVFM